MLSFLMIHSLATTRSVLFLVYNENLFFLHQCKENRTQVIAKKIKFKKNNLLNPLSIFKRLGFFYLYQCQSTFQHRLRT